MFFSSETFWNILLEGQSTRFHQREYLRVLYHSKKQSINIISHPQACVLWARQCFLSIVQNKVAYVVGRKGKRQNSALTSTDRDATVTVIACVSVSGHFYYTLRLFRTNMPRNVNENCTPGLSAGQTQLNSFKLTTLVNGSPISFKK